MTTMDDILNEAYKKGSDSDKMLMVRLSAWVTMNSYIDKIDVASLLKLLNDLVDNHKELAVTMLATSFLMTVGQQRQGTESGSEVDIEKLINGDE